MRLKPVASGALEGSTFHQPAPASTPFQVTAGALRPELLEIPGGHPGGVVIDLGIELVEGQGEGAHVGLHGILGLPGGMPDLGHGVQAVLVHPVVVEEIAAVAHVLMGEMPVRVVAEFGEVIVRERLLRHHLVCHPLGGLLPEVAAVPLVIPERRLPDVGRLLVQDQVTRDLVLEGVAYFVGHGGAAVRRFRIHPQAAGDVVLGAGTVGRPFGLVP